VSEPDRMSASPPGQLHAISVTGDYVERPWASEVHDGLESRRNGVVIAHRRAGKTVLMVAQLVRDYFAALIDKKPNPQCAFIAPTAKQARSVAWPYFRMMLKHIPGVEFREHMLEIEMPAGGRFILASGEKYDRLRGLYLDAAVVDEAADSPDALVTQVLRPALADRQGKLYLIGTVKGRGMLWQTYERALKSPDWYASKWLPHQTGALAEEELAMLKREMSEEEYAQEMLCDPGAAVKGSYYGRALRELEEGGGVCKVPFDQQYAVTIGMDLGIADSTAIWIAQLMRGGEIRVLEYLEFQNTGFVQILKELQGKPYQIDRWIGPHDLRVREYTSGQTRIDAARELGIEFEVAPKLPVIDGIEAVRRALPRMVFDEDKTRAGINALALYRSEFDETRRVLSRNPVHDWTSHAADAMRYLVTGTSGGQRDLFTRFAPIDYSAIDKVSSWR
jgi:phage terminase large subunit